MILLSKSFLWLCLLCVVMFGGAMGAGMLPVSVSVSHQRMKYITTCGVGMLVGAAFLIIVPEGIHTIYGAHEQHSLVELAHEPAFYDGLVGGEQWDWTHGGSTGGSATHTPPPDTKDIRRSTTDRVTTRTHPMQDTTSSSSLDDDNDEWEWEYYYTDEEGHEMKQDATDNPTTSPKINDAGGKRSGSGPIDQQAHDDRPRDSSSIDGGERRRRRRNWRLLQDRGSPQNINDDGALRNEKDSRSSANRKYKKTRDGASGEHAHTHQLVHTSCETPWAAQYIGLSLVLGFVFMMIIDQISGDGHGHAHGPTASATTSTISSAAAANTGTLPRRRALAAHQRKKQDDADGGRDIEMDALIGTNVNHGTSSAAGGYAGGSSSAEHAEGAAGKLSPRAAAVSNPIGTDGAATSVSSSEHHHQHAHGGADNGGSAVIAMYVHSAVDGIALGAISVGQNAALGLIVFFAILLHKVPAAFGLSSLLMQKGHSVAEIRKTLLIFSACAPIAAIVTFLALSQQASIVDPAPLGLSLLFSGGTILYTVAVHVLPEIRSQQEENQGDWKINGSLMLGIFLPFLFSSMHGHVH